jgi:hypothetical protein
MLYDPFFLLISCIYMVFSSFPVIYMWLLHFSVLVIFFCELFIFSIMYIYRFLSCMSDPFNAFHAKLHIFNGVL